MQQVYYADRKIKMLQREMNDLRDTLYSFGRSPSDLTHDRVQASSDPDKMLALISKISSKEQEIIARIYELVDMKTVISNQIQKLGDTKYTEVLHSRYVMCSKWEDIAAQMGKTERWVLRLHGRALHEFEKKFSPLKPIGH